MKKHARIGLGIVRRLTDYKNPNSFGSRMRRRRVAPLVELIRSAHREHGEVRILDLGGTKRYWNILPSEVFEDHRMEITVLNLSLDAGEKDDDVFTHVTGDACDLSEYPDNSFHIVHSNSVIEHVGDWKHMKRFACEARRVGLGLFIQAPYFWFPVEPHFMTPFFHWIPPPLQIALLSRFALGHQTARSENLDAAIASSEMIPRLVDKKMYRLLFPDCRIVKERFMFLTKSLIAVRDVAS